MQHTPEGKPIDGENREDRERQNNNTNNNNNNNNENANNNNTNNTNNNNNGTQQPAMGDAKKPDDPNVVGGAEAKPKEEDSAAAQAAAAQAPVVKQPVDSGERDQFIDWRLDYAIIQQLKKSNEKSFSTEPQAMHGVEFQLLVFPFGKSPHEFGCFLKRSDLAVAQNWCCMAAFRFTLVNQLDKAKSKEMTEESPKLWDSEHNDWGFWNMGIENTLIYDEREGFLVDGFITLRTRLIRLEKVTENANQKKKKKSRKKNRTNKILMLKFIIQNTCVAKF